MSIRRPLALAILSGLLIASGCRKEVPAPEPESKPESSKDAAAKDKKPESDKDGKKTVEPPRPPTVTAVALTEAFLTDAKKAEAKYRGKRIAVEGTVATASQNSVKKTGQVVLRGHKTKPDDPLPLAVTGSVKPAAAVRVGLLAKGQKVRLIGRLAEASAGNVTLSDCDYEELTSLATPRVKAEAVIKEFAADKEEAAKKYLDKELIVTGTVEDLVEKNGSFFVRLAGEGKSRVSCTLEEDEFKTLKKGDKVRIKGEAALFDSGELVVNSAFLLPPT
jgi:hypothetical protein